MPKRAATAGKRSIRIRWAVKRKERRTERREESAEKEEKETVTVMPLWLYRFDLWDSWHFGLSREMTEEAGRDWREGGRA